MAPGDVTVRVDLDEVMSLLMMILERVGTMATQDDVDRLTAALGQFGDRLSTGLSTLTTITVQLPTAIDNIRADIAGLKDQLTVAGVTLDLSGLEANVTRMGDLAGQVNAATGQLGSTAADAQELAAETPDAAPGP
jgi:ABC-type transporter Mla subunit MlaD